LRVFATSVETTTARAKDPDVRDAGREAAENIRETASSNACLSPK
jgi:hypothetical protein